jgi:hypothetical protein
MDGKYCDTCLFGIYKDYGYSDLTVQGTSFYCRRNLRPTIPDVERFEVIEKPDHCQVWESGKPQHLSVDSKLPKGVHKITEG